MDQCSVARTNSDVVLALSPGSPSSHMTFDPPDEKGRESLACD